MKAFIIATMLAGAVLFMTALFWPDHSPSVAARNQRSLRVTAPIEASERQRIQHIDRSTESPPQSGTPGTPVTPTAATSTGQLTSLPPSLAPTSNKPALEPKVNNPTDAQLTPDEQQTFKQTATDDTSLRDPDFPRTYISKIHVDLASPNHSVTLTWTGPNAPLHPTTQYHSSPGRGLGNNNCDDPAESCRVNSNCTPKGTMHVRAFSHSMVTSPECRFVTWFDTSRGIALHYYPNVPNYPASHGCVRLGNFAAQLIHNNAKIGETEVVVDGKWTFVR